MLWALGELGLSRHPAVRPLPDDVLRRGLQCFADRDINDVLWALGELGQAEHPAVSLLTEERQRRGVDKLVPHEVSNMLRALGLLNSPDRQLLNGLMANLQHCDFDEITTHGVCNMLWAVDRLGLIEHPAVEVLAREALRREKLQSTNSIGRSRIRRALRRLGMGKSLALHNQGSTTRRQVPAEPGEPGELRRSTGC